MASLFQACKAAVRNKQGGTFNIGGYDIDVEYYTQQDINDDIQYGDISFGDTDESKIVLVAGETITVPSGYILTPDKPKKSLVIFCNNLVNNGTISMYQKAPNTLPHDFYIIQGSVINSNRNVIVPAYANNQVTKNFSSNKNGADGVNGTNRNCGSGGTCSLNSTYNVSSTAGSGYAFGGGAGSGAYKVGNSGTANSVDSTYPMRGSDANGSYQWFGGGVGNPVGKNFTWTSGTDIPQNFGCGGRVIIFCANFTNNGTITVNGTSTHRTSSEGDPYYGGGCGHGGASGAGAVDLFYHVLSEQGTITANGGDTFNFYSTPGKGGNGSITLTQWSLDKVIKEERKMFTQSNWTYLFDQYTTRLREDVI